MPPIAPNSRSEAVESAIGDDTPTQDDLYATAIAELGPSLARLAAAYELDPGLQQDLLQELHVALWRSFATFKRQCSLRTWVYRVAHNTASGYVRKHKRFRREVLMSLEQLEELSDPTDAERLHDETEVIGKLGTLIRRLKPIDREVILLYLEGMDAASIGEVLGISPGNVAQKIHRTKNLLKRCFQFGD